MVRFEIKDRDAAGRLGVLKTEHGSITTPALLPVINPNKMLIEAEEMKKRFGAEIVITNSYIIYKKNSLREKALADGVHSLLGFDGTIMTDSGTFQSYVYNDIDVDPLEIVDFQREIGSDIGTILDVFTTPDTGYQQAEKQMMLTVERAKKSVTRKGDMLLACTVQGGIFPELRTKCAQQLSRIDADVYPIGGVVPLMENQVYDILTNSIVAAKKGLNPSKPVHLFGAGHPLVFPLAVALGCDLVDSAAYAKYAADGRMIFPWGTEKLEELSELPCSCPVCSGFTAKELRGLDEMERIKNIALHNLYVSFAEMQRIRDAIRKGKLWELVEQKAGYNPALFDALRVLENEDNKEWLERFEPVSKPSALVYTGVHTVHRPLIYRYQKRLLERYRPRESKRVVVVPEVSKPYSRFYKKDFEMLDCDVVVDSVIGPVPLMLDEMYPVAQSVFPRDIDEESREFAKKVMDSFLEKYGLETGGGEKNADRDVDLERIASVVDMQFGGGAADVLLDGKIVVKKSKKTGKIRNVFVDGKHILSLRAHDGLFTLKTSGAKRLHRSFSSPRLRVVITDECKPFIMEGKSVFARFVVDCDPDLRPFDECLIVSEDDDLLGVGRTLLNREEMLSFDYGVAVKTREGVKE
ncbi:MAG: tRNA guanosine(15) transglycosylase TgtA [Thermoplasmata archaeon]|nr:MAG: tRNA guanosine(15) transglycosylase TgtA [Thermoplasmata archaeon]